MTLKGGGGGEGSTLLASRLKQSGGEARVVRLKLQVYRVAPKDRNVPEHPHRPREIKNIAQYSTSIHVEHDFASG